MQYKSYLIFFFVLSYFVFFVFFDPSDFLTGSPFCICFVVFRSSLNPNYNFYEHNPPNMIKMIKIKSVKFNKVRSFLVHKKLIYFEEYNSPLNILNLLVKLFFLLYQFCFGARISPGLSFKWVQVRFIRYLFSRISILSGMLGW